MLKVVVIGGVAAGMSAASKLKRNLKDDVEITVFERGGDVSYGACGIPFYVSGVIAKPDNLVARSAEKFRESGIDVKLHHEVVSVDTKTKTVRVQDHNLGKLLNAEYDKLIIGSGARSNILPQLDNKDNVLSVNNLVDAYNLRTALERNDIKDVTIIGGGYIGLEIADACKPHNKNVTIIEAAPRVLSNMDEEFSEKIEQELQNNGVIIKKNSRITSVEGSQNNITAIAIDNGEQHEEIRTDLVVCCVGVIPNTEFISDVDKHINGAIKVDSNMQSSVTDVYAAGDCSIMRSFVTGEWQYMPLGTNANKQGRVVADVIAGKLAPEFKLIGSTAIKLFDCDAAKVGISEQEAKALGLDYKTTTVTANSFASYYSSEKLTIKLVYESGTKKILGAQLAGQGTVVPRANYFAIAISSGISADEYGFTDLCYSPPFSGVWDASLIAANTCK